MSAQGSHDRGRAAEAQALAHLERAGLTLLARNFRCRAGEIDLILRDGPVTVIAEVRCRADHSHGTPAETVDARKQRRLIACAGIFLQTRPELARAPLRFDVVAVGGAATALEWMKDAFRA